MKIIGFFFRPFVKTGAHKRYLELLGLLADKGHSVTLLHWEGVRYRLPNVKLVPIYKKDFSKTGTFLEIFSLIRNRKKIKNETTSADCLFLFGERNFIQAFIISKFMSKTKIITAIRSNFVEAAKMVQDAFPVHSLIRKGARFLDLQRLRMLEKFILSYSTGVVLQTEYDSQSIKSRNLCHSAQIEIVPNSAETSWMQNGLGLLNTSKKCKHLIYVGSVGKRKGFHFLFKAVESLINDGYSVRLEVCGGGRQVEDYRQKVAEDKKLQGKIIFSGYVDDVMERIAGNDVLVVPSLYDSFPNVIFEAMHVGTPVLGSKSGGIPTMLGYDELLFQPADIQSLCIKLKELFDSPDQYMKVKEMSRSRLSLFSFDWAERFIAALEHILYSS